MSDSNQTATVDLSFGAIADRVRRGDIALALGIVAILILLILPLPSPLLDFALALSITLSVLVLMTVLFIDQPLEFSAFPTILLLTTMLRLALNISSTRLILSHGHEGTDAAGHVIEAFGNFVMQGNFVIGIIVFSILVLVNFIVITKGSGRIAEVSARFSLDSMPGKQMAIDADLSAGLIDEEEAKSRRQKLEGESNFFGAMDGASKFVRGDAIAGLLITLINIMGGIIIGVAQSNMSFGEAANTYTLLTIGDGLVSQIPALIVSTAAGILVSKAGVEGTADKALFGQLSGHPQALGMASFLMTVMALLPGIPKVPFLLLAGASAYGAWSLTQKKEQVKLDDRLLIEQQKEDEPPTEEPISQTLAMDSLRIELGYGLLPLINDAEGHRLTDQIKSLRKQIATEMGFVMPSVRILDNMQLEPQNYVIRIKEMEAGAGDLVVGHLLVMDPSGQPIDLPGISTTEPTFGLPAMWIEEGMREEASFRGLTVVDPTAVLTTHLTELLKDNMAELLSYAETSKLIDELPPQHRKLVDDIVPSQISKTSIQRVLQMLLNERISIRDLPTILEGIAEAISQSSSIVHITEHVRMRLSRQLCHANADIDGHLPLLTMSPEWEQAFADSLIGQGDEKQLSMAPSKLQEFISDLRNTFEDMAAQGQMPVLLTSPLARPYVRSIVERFRSQTVVMSQNEIHPQAKLKTLGQI